MRIFVSGHAGPQRCAPGIAKGIRAMRANLVRRVSTIVAVGVMLGAAAGAFAGPMAIIVPGGDPVIVVGPGGEAGNYELLENTPGQWIEIFVSSGEQVAGCNFSAQIGGGGPQLGGTLGPIITSVDFEGSPGNPTIFFGNNKGPNNLDVIGVPQIAMYSIITDSGTVLADGLLARVEIDTTGFFGDRTWSLTLSQPPQAPTNFAPLPVAITDGAIHIPEPASMILLAFGGAFIARRRRG